jgi:formate dehydrogenase subunit gamma
MKTRTSFVNRFSVTERTLHWLIAGSFASLMLSGLMIESSFGLPWHIASGCVMVASLLVMLIRGRSRRILAATVHDLAHFTEEDREWLRSAPEHMRGRAEAPPAGRFNAGQKLNARALAILLPLTLISGVLAVTNLPGGGLHGALIVATSIVVGSHVFMATVNPSTRHALRGMVFGSVRRDWAKKHHPLWLARLER